MTPPPWRVRPPQGSSWLRRVRESDRYRFGSRTCASSRASAPPSRASGGPCSRAGARGEPVKVPADGRSDPVPGALAVASARVRFTLEPGQANRRRDVGGFARRCAGTTTVPLGGWYGRSAEDVRRVRRRPAESLGGRGRRLLASHGPNALPEEQPRRMAALLGRYRSQHAAHLVGARSCSPSRSGDGDPADRLTVLNALVGLRQEGKPRAR